MSPFKKRSSKADAALAAFPEAIDQAAEKWRRFYTTIPFAKNVPFADKIAAFAVPFSDGARENVAGLRDAPDGVMMMIVAKAIVRSKTHTPDEVAFALGLPRSLLEDEDTAPQSDNSGSTTKAGLGCDFSGWMRDGDRILQRYVYQGAGLDRTLIVELRVEQGALAPLRMPYLWLSPANGYEGSADLRFNNDATRETTGWLPGQLMTATGDSTLFSVNTRESADAVWRQFSSGHDLEFAVRQNGETLLELPLPNGRGVQEAYQAIIAHMEVRI